MTQEHLHREAAPLGPSDIIHDDAVPSIPTAEYRRVALATAVGTTIE